jgi:hypothetical protein
VHCGGGVDRVEYVSGRVGGWNIIIISHLFIITHK